MNLWAVDSGFQSANSGSIAASCIGRDEDMDSMQHQNSMQQSFPTLNKDPPMIYTPMDPSITKMDTSIGSGQQQQQPMYCNNVHNNVNFVNSPPPPMYTTTTTIQNHQNHPTQQQFRTNQQHPLPATSVPVMTHSPQLNSASNQQLGQYQTSQQHHQQQPQQQQMFVQQTQFIDNSQTNTSMHLSNAEQKSYAPPNEGQPMMYTPVDASNSAQRQMYCNNNNFVNSPPPMHIAMQNHQNHPQQQQYRTNQQHPLPATSVPVMAHSPQLNSASSQPLGQYPSSQQPLFVQHQPSFVDNSQNVMMQRQNSVQRPFAADNDGQPMMYTPMDSLNGQQQMYNSNFVSSPLPMQNSPANQACMANTGISPTMPTSGSQCADSEDSKLTIRAIPKVIKLMKDEDQSVVYKSVAMVHQLSTREASRKAIVQSPELMQTLSTLMANSTETETLKVCTAIFYNMSQHRPGLQAIYQYGGVFALVRLLDSPVESVINYAITILHNLLLHHEGSKHAVRTSGGLAKMIRLLDRDNYKFLAIVADCLQILAYCNQEGKLIIMQNNGPVALVCVLNKFSYEKLLWTTTRVLKVLSVCPENKKAIVNAGGLQALATHLNHPTSARLVLNCLWTLRNLSNAATQQTNLQPLLQNLVCLLASNDINIITCVAGILANLTCNNETNKQVVYQVNGIPALVQTLIKASDRQEILAPTLCTLRHLTCRHSHAEHCQNQIRVHYGLPHLIRLLHPPSKWPVIKAVIGLIRNLAICDANHQPLREHNVIQRLYQLLSKACQEIKRINSNYSMPMASSAAALTTEFSKTDSNANSNLNSSVASNGVEGGAGVGAGFADGIHMNEIIEGAMGTLRILATNAENRNLILRLVPDVMSICVELLYNQIENICRSAVGCLNELAIDVNGAQRIAFEGGVAPLTNLMNSSNENISATASAVLFKINGHKHPPAYPLQPQLQLSQQQQQQQQQIQQNHQQQHLQQQQQHLQSQHQPQHLTSTLTPQLPPQQQTSINSPRMDLNSSMCRDDDGGLWDPMNNDFDFSLVMADDSNFTSE